jgi:hypothetical protein
VTWPAVYFETPDIATLPPQRHSVLGHAAGMAIRFEPWLIVGAVYGAVKKMDSAL